MWLLVGSMRDTVPLRSLVTQTVRVSAAIPDGLSTTSIKVGPLPSWKGKVKEMAPRATRPTTTIAIATNVILTMAVTLCSRRGGPLAGGHVGKGSGSTPVL